MDYISAKMNVQKKIALVAHDNMKKELNIPDSRLL